MTVQQPPASQDPSVAAIVAAAQSAARAEVLVRLHRCTHDPLRDPVLTELDAVYWRMPAPEPL